MTAILLAILSLLAISLGDNDQKLIGAMFMCTACIVDALNRRK